MYSLKLENTTTKVSITLSGLTDLEASALNYVFNINLPEGLDTGEYEYSLIDDQDNVVAVGLCQIGNYTPNVTPYSAQTTGGYLQYES